MFAVHLLFLRSKPYLNLPRARTPQNKIEKCLKHHDKNKEKEIKLAMNILLALAVPASARLYLRTRTQRTRQRRNKQKSKKRDVIYRPRGIFFCPTRKTRTSETSNISGKKIDMSVSLPEMVYDIRRWWCITLVEKGLDHEEAS